MRYVQRKFNVVHKVYHQNLILLHSTILTHHIQKKFYMYIFFLSYYTAVVRFDVFHAQNCNCLLHIHPISMK